CSQQISKEYLKTGRGRKSGPASRPARNGSKCGSGILASLNDGYKRRLAPLRLPFRSPAVLVAGRRKVVNGAGRGVVGHNPLCGPHAGTDRHLHTTLIRLLDSAKLRGQLVCFAAKIDVQYDFGGILRLIGSAVDGVDAEAHVV